MALDPKAKEFLDGLPPPVSLQGMPPQEVRALLNGRLLTLDSPAEPVAAVEERTIPADGGSIRCRIYRPGGPPPFPALIYFHGGGWVVGNLDTHDGACRAVANSARAVVVSVDYRLAPEHRFPTAVEDAFAATCWVAAAPGLGIDPARLAVGGDSAGGNLAAVVCLLARERGGPPLQAQALIYPVTDHSFDTESYRANADGYFLTRAKMEYFWSQYLGQPGDGASPHASPLRASDLRGLPPAVVVLAGYDPLCDEGEAYAARLAAAGVPVEVQRYDEMIHGFLLMGGFLEQAHAARREIGRFLERACYSCSSRMSPSSSR